MVFLIGEDNRILNFYSGMVSQLENMVNADHVKRQGWREVIFEDDQNVLNDNSKYRLIFDGDNKPIGYAEKPVLTLSFQDGDDELIGDGVDTVNLIWAITGLTAEEELSPPTSIKLWFNDAQVEIDASPYPIMCIDADIVIRIQGDRAYYQSNMLELQVI